jgi:hypothetical protein
MSTNVKTTKTTVKVRISLPCGVNDKGKQTRTYVQQVIGPNTAKTPSANGQVYDWVIGNAGKPGSNFSKLGRTAADETGLFRVKFELGDGIYRIVRPNVDKRTDSGAFTGWPETVFAKVSNGQLTAIDQNAARAAVGLPPVSVKAKGASYLDDDDDDLSI